MHSVLIAGVGYSHLTDMSVGPTVAAELQQESWPPHVAVEDWSYGPVSIVHRLHEPDGGFTRIVLIGAIDRALSAGTIQVYQWDGVLPPPDTIQTCVAEAVTGIVSLDNLVVVTAQFADLPREVFIIEVQPLLREFGLTFSPLVQAALPRVKELARAIAEGRVARNEVPVMPLGGMMPHAS